MGRCQILQLDKIARGDKVARKYFCNAWLELDKEKKKRADKIRKGENTYDEILTHCLGRHLNF